MSEQTYQSRSQMVACAVGAVVFFFIGLSGLIAESSLGGKIGAICLGWIPSVVLYRYAQARLTSTTDGVRVSNPFSSYRLGWTEIERFELGRWKISPAVCLIQLRDGQTKPVLGVIENSIGSGGGRESVDELNKELHRVPWPSGSVHPASPGHSTSQPK
jgi:hypothetical protein